MTREIFHVDDAQVAQALVAFAETLGFTISNNIHEMGVDNYLTTGSKKTDINWIRRSEFANDKQSRIFSLVGEDGAHEFLSIVLEAHADNNVHDEVNLHQPEVLTPDADTICALYNKVKGQKKAPSRYHVTLKDGHWVATTTDADSYGNLTELYTAVQG
jgi:hypothetical protein